MQLGRCCLCEMKRLVTIKGINTTTGVTTWEYGPGTMWRDHYGLDRITGIQCNTAATLNRHVVESQGHAGLTHNMTDRSVTTLVANVMEPLTFTVLNSLTGAVVTSAVTVEGLFCTAVYANGFLPLIPAVARAAAGLSNDWYLLVGDELPPQLELVGFASNTANKSYIFHAHGLQAGNVTLVTRTTSETVTLAYNVTAASMKTTLEATADVVTAVCTGGPWPLLKINVDITWSVAGGDFKSLTHDKTYSVGGTPRSTSGSAYAYDPATGLLKSTFGYRFGRGTDKAEARLITITGPITVPVDVALKRAGNTCGAGASATVGLIADIDSIECWTVVAGSDAWTFGWLKIVNTVGGYNPFGPIPEKWFRAEANSITSGFGRAVFTGPTRTLCAYHLNLATGTVTELDFPDTVGTSPTNLDNQVSVLSHDGGTGTQTAYEYKNTNVTPKFKFHVESGEMQCGGLYFHLGCTPIYGADATQFYGQSSGGTPTFNAQLPSVPPAAISGSSAKSYLWTFHSSLHEHYATGTEFRFRFAGGNASNPALYSNWVDWLATKAQIEAAVLAGISENTEGVVSSCTVYLFGLPAYSITNATGYLERGLEIRFAGAVDATGLFWGFKTGSVYFASGKVTIETRTATYTTTGGITAWNRTTGAPVWTRKFGTALGTANTIDSSMAWVKSGLLFSVGGPVTNELP